MYRRILTVAAVFYGIALCTTTVQGEEAHVGEVKKYVAANVVPWLNDKIVIDALKAQNAKHATLAEADIIKLDKEWRAQVDAPSKPLIESVTKNALSAFVTTKKAESKGLLTEIFVMDDKGLNVGQSDITSDYWQGDEAKWQKTFKVGADAVFVDKVEKDESTQQLQVQVSISIKDPETGKVIGAVTLGINVDQLSS
jgi:nicotinate-nucleotide pyrophosphorylase